MPKRLSDDGSVRPSFRVPKDLDEKLRGLAASRGWTLSAEYQAAIEAWAAVDAIAGKDQRGVRRVAQVGPAPDLILPEVAEPGAWVEGVIADGKKVVTSVKRPHRWVAVAPGSPVRHCERCRLKEMVVRRDGPEFCGGV